MLNFISRIRINLFIALCLILVHDVSSQNYYPSKDWERKEAKEFKIDQKQLQEAIDFAVANEYSGERDLRLAILKSFSREPDHKLLGPTKERGGPAGIILKNGYIIAEWGDLDRVDMTFSVTKSYLSTAFGLALDQDLIGDVNEKVDQYIWDGTFDGEHNSQITWQHLLHQTSDWSGTLFGLNDWADRPDPKGSLDSWKYRELHQPGTHFKYNDVRVNILSYSLLQVWRKPLPMVLKESIMDPIGASTTWRWYGYDNSWTVIDGKEMSSVSGGGHHGGGMFVNTYDQARFGLLFSRNGKWEGSQLISSEWVEMIQTPALANESYGYMWWLNRGPRHWEDTPDHLFYAAGFGGNFIVVDQQQDLVIITRWLEPSKIGEMVKKVYSAL
ncbi:MAG: serine hydrolase [Flammeovirgaceae bacterium]|nr:serine hydrolase [Flammeovirgaceae bacterium]MBR09653.1 serine hydrolase [Rickettsiales bacterium]HCX22834.1 serine hydrolase [Cytophagales bacterium]